MTLTFSTSSRPSLFPADNCGDAIDGVDVIDRRRPSTASCAMNESSWSTSITGGTKEVTTATCVPLTEFKRARTRPSSICGLSLFCVVLMNSSKILLDEQQHGTAQGFLLHWPSTVCVYESLVQCTECLFENILNQEKMLQNLELLNLTLLIDELCPMDWLDWIDWLGWIGVWFTYIIFGDALCYMLLITLEQKGSDKICTGLSSRAREGVLLSVMSLHGIGIWDLVVFSKIQYLLLGY